jgi:cytochrome c-type biogenesis protein CcmH/NrfG
MQLPDGMYLYEFVLLILGVLLFVVLLIVLIFFAAQKRPLKVLSTFFVFPIVMIGFPSYQKITFDKDVITIEKTAHELSTNPTNVAARQELQKTLASVEARSESNPQILLKIGQAQAALGDTIKALTVVDSALRLNPKVPDGILLKNEFSAPLERLQNRAHEVATHPGDQAAKMNLVRDLAALERTGNKSNAVLVAAANAHASIGDTMKAKILLDSVLKRDANHPEALNLRRKLEPRKGPP